MADALSLIVFTPIQRAAANNAPATAGVVSGKPSFFNRFCALREDIGGRGKRSGMRTGGLVYFICSQPMEGRKRSSRPAVPVATSDVTTFMPESSRK